MDMKECGDEEWELYYRSGLVGDVGKISEIT